MIFFYIAVALLFFYGILFQFYHSWWNDLPTFTGTGVPVTSLSVIVPARNEERNIAACIHSLCRQQYPNHLLQIIVIDDNSTDNTFTIATEIVNDDIEKICIQLAPAQDNTAPKKRAIEAGIAIARGTLIITTDADCTADPLWLAQIALYYEQTGKVFIAAPVAIASESSLLAKFQALDFLTMQGITAAAVHKRFHNMCNGANLAYEKKVFYEVGRFAGIDSIASGDDMLLMNKIAKRYPAKTGFIKSPDAIVTTLPAANWRSFFQQRIRWASKATHYKQPGIFLVLLLVYLTNLMIFCFLLIGFAEKFALLLFLLLCIAKCCMEFFFVKDTAAFFKKKDMLPWLLLLQPMHIIYIVLSGFLGQFKTYEWKGRRLR